MSAVALLSKKPNPTDSDIDDAMSATSAAAAPTNASEGHPPRRIHAAGKAKSAA